MPARIAGGLHDQLDIALAVEGAGIADIAVVVDQVDDIGGLAPAHALEVDAERGADRAARDIEREGRRLDPIRAGLLLAAAHVDAQPVLAAEVVGHLELECGRALRVGGGLGDRGRGSLPAGSGHAVADDAGPVELVGLARLKAFAAHHHRLLNA